MIETITLEAPVPASDIDRSDDNTIPTESAMEQDEISSDSDSVFFFGAWSHIPSHPILRCSVVQLIQSNAIWSLM